MQKPGKEFSGLIEKFWYMPWKEGVSRRMHEILPDGSFAFLFAVSESGCRILYVGPFTELRRVLLLDRLEYFCVQFRPGRMLRVADIAAADLVNSWAVLPKLFGVSADEIGEDLYRAPTIRAKQQLIEALFRKTEVAKLLPKGAFVQCVGAVDEAGGAIRVDELADRVGVSPRTLERLFLEHVGISPKTFARMVRFQNAVARLRSGRSFSSFADLAIACGYTDQSHFIKDFKTLAQRLPSEFRLVAFLQYCAANAW